MRSILTGTISIEDVAFIYQDIYYLNLTQKPSEVKI